MMERKEGFICMLSAFSIRFVNLGITIKHLAKAFYIGNFPIAYYGVIILIGVIAGCKVAFWEAKKTGQDEEMYFDFAFFAVLFSIIGARIYYVVFDWDLYKDNLLQIFNFRAGGLAIYGGIIGAVITLLVFAKKRKVSARLMMDTGVLGLVTGQIIGRWGNFVNREAFGGYTDGIFAMQIRKSEVYPWYITEEIANHILLIDGVEYIQVHPTFLYESLWNIGVLIFLLAFRRRKKFTGEVFCWYLIGYGIGRFWIEGFRTDQLLIGSLPVSQVLSALLAVGSSIYVIWKHWDLRRKEWEQALHREQ